MANVLLPQIALIVEVFLLMVVLRASTGLQGGLNNLQNKPLVRFPMGFSLIVNSIGVGGEKSLNGEFGKVYDNAYFIIDGVYLI